MTEQPEVFQDAAFPASPGPVGALSGGHGAETERGPATGLVPPETPIMLSAQVPDSGSELASARDQTSAPAFVYAIGQIEPRFPTLGIEKEFAQVLGQSGAAGLTDRQGLKAMLSEPANRYLARQLCWVLTIEGLDTYILRPRFPQDIDLLIDAVRPTPRATDIDVVIGFLGPVAPPELCNALMIPILVFDHIYSFDVDTLLGAIPRPDDVDDEHWTASTNELFGRITQMNDNAGATDADRALNYLSVRYPAIYHSAADKFAANSSLTSVEVRPSRLTAARRIVEVIFSYTDRSTDVTEKQFVRVDITEEFPFLVSKLAPYFERGA